MADESSGRDLWKFWRFSTAAVVPLMLMGCGAADPDQDPGPGDGPVADEASPAERPRPPEGSPSGAAPAPAASSVLARGEFVNKSYSGSGSALFVKGTDGAPFLRLENIAISSGPALNVLLTKHPSPSTKADVAQGSVDLGVLRATKGNLTYTIPAGMDVAGYRGVIVYCVDYDVVFTAAAMTSEAQ